jgi:DNA-binding LacI/PurR family transcriptional regulator
MSIAFVETETTRKLAARLEQDIRRRGLAPGDRYLSTIEAARLLGVSTTTCNRAMRLLAERSVLTRRRNRGTHIGQKVQPSPVSVIRTVYVLRSQDRLEGYMSSEAVMRGLWRALPGVDLHFAILPPADPAGYVKQLLKVAPYNNAVGVVAVGCHRDVYDFLLTQSLPVVVMGSVDPNEDQLASIDGDQERAGLLLAEHLVACGHTNMVLLMSESWRPGNNNFLRGVEQALELHGLPIALRVRSLPNDRRMIQQQVLQLIAEAQTPPAFICHLPAAPRAIADLLTSEPSVPGDLAVVYHSDCERPAVDTMPFAYTYIEKSREDMAEEAGRMLLDMSNGTALGDRHRLLQNKLHVPRHVQP